jgi:hypothetical protein
MQLNDCLGYVQAESAAAPSLELLGCEVMGRRGWRDVETGEGVEGWKRGDGRGMGGDDWVG